MWLVEVIALAPLGIGLLLWFRFPPESGSSARLPPRSPPCADLAHEDPQALQASTDVGKQS
jgi:hypothetical protein